MHRSNSTAAAPAPAQQAAQQQLRTKTVTAQTALQYFQTGNYPQAKLYYDTLAATYRNTHWQSLLTSTLFMSLQCAYQLQDTTSAISLTLELLGMYTQLSPTQTAELTQQLLALLHSTAAAHTLTQHIFPLQPQNLLTLFTHFNSYNASVSVGQEFHTVLKLQSYLPLPFEVTALECMFNIDAYNVTILPNTAQTVKPLAITHAHAAQQHDAHLLKPDSSNNVYSSELSFAAFTPTTTASALHTLASNSSGSPAVTHSYTILHRAHTAVSQLHLTQLIAHVALQQQTADGVTPLSPTIIKLRIAAEPETYEEQFVPPPEPVVEDKKKSSQSAATTAAAPPVAVTLPTPAHFSTALTITPPQSSLSLTSTHAAPALQHEYYPIQLQLNRYVDPFLASSPLHSTAAVDVFSIDNARLRVESFIILPREEKKDQLGAAALSGAADDKDKNKDGDSNVRYVTSDAKFYVRNGNDVSYGAVTAADLLPLDADHPFALSALQSSASLPSPLLLYMHSSTLHTYQVNFTLTYENEQRMELSSTHSITIPVKAAWNLKYKMLSDCLTGMFGQASVLGTPDSAGHTQKLVLNVPAVLHCELENVSGHNLSFSHLELELPNDMFQVEQPTQIKHTSHTMTQTALDTVSTSTAQPVLLLPGERYTRLFYFKPIATGTTYKQAANSAAVRMKWARVQQKLPETEKDDSEAQPSTAGAATDAATPKQAARRASIDGHPIISRQMSMVKRESVSLGLLVQPSLHTLHAAHGSHASSSPAITDRSSLDSTTGSIAVEWHKSIMIIQVVQVPISVRINYPPTVTFGDTFDLVLSLNNHTNDLHDIDLHIMEAEHQFIRFCWNGPIKSTIHLLPQSSSHVRWRFSPVDCGALSLPKLLLQAKTNGGGGVLLDQNELGTVFVKPRNKGVEAAQLQSRTTVLKMEASA